MNEGELLQGLLKWKLNMFDHIIRQLPEPVRKEVRGKELAILRAVHGALAPYASQDVGRQQCDGGDGVESIRIE